MNTKANEISVGWTEIALHILAWIMYGFLINLTHRLIVPVVTITDTVSSIVPYMLSFYVSLGGFYLLKAQRLTLGVLVFVLAFIVLAFLAYAYIYWLMPALGIVLYTSADLNLFVSQAIWGFIYMFGAAAIYYLIPRLLKREREIIVMEKEALQKELEIATLTEKELKATQEKLTFENAFLRAQINPHFLHNTLNALSSEIFIYSPELSSTINTLAEIMEYAMNSTTLENDKVPVALELKHLERLLEIHNYRQEKENQPTTITMDGEPGMQLIPPMTLVTIVENALKYGDFTHSSSPLTLKFVCRDQFFRFICKNKKRKLQPGETSAASHGIGLVNVKRRLHEAFCGNCKMDIQDMGDTFTVVITVEGFSY